jgi:GNAT superfamily N-acetyltransferase
MVSMRTLSLGWATDLAVLEQMGSSVEDRGDHLVVRSPRNPQFHWGNFIFVTDPTTVDDAARWVRTFGAAVSGADWVAIGLARMPTDVDGWATCGLELERDDVLATSTMPRQAPVPAGYDVHALSGDDWEQVVSGALADNDRAAGYEPTSHERFARARAQAQRDLSERGVATFVGAFFDGQLVAELGIVACGITARYQTVGTAREHRRRGLASHLLGVAARWASDHGCTQWVIVTEASNPAGRVYRTAGFELAVPSVQAYRPPAR